MKRFLLALAFFLLPALVWANGNTCTCTGACSLNSGTNWSGAASCTDAGGPDSGAGTDDGIVVASGGNLSWDQTGTRTYRNLWIQPGGAATVTVTPVVMQFDVSFSAFGGSFSDVFFLVGDSGNNQGTFTSTGKDLTINWVGTGTSSILLGTPAAGGQNDPNNRYTSVTMRGVERAATFVTNYSRGATAPTPDTNMVDCLDGNTAPTGGALSDTIVFTTGKSQEYWYEVSGYPDQCTGAAAPFANCTAADATAECSAVACGGGPCDYQITRNSTGSTPGTVGSGSTWNSMTMVAGLGGPFRHATPDDSDANGTANGDGLLPVVGDRFVVFKPVLIQGGTNPITNGIIVLWMNGGIDWRYVEINKGGGHFAENCNSVDSVNSADILRNLRTLVTSPEGALEYLNVHNAASFIWEINGTDDPTDFRPQRDFTLKHAYFHDTDPQVETTCGAAGQQGEGFGIDLALDATSDLVKNVTVDGLHIARLANGAAIATKEISTTVQPTNLLFKNVLIHTIPRTTTYGNAGPTPAINLSGGSGEVTGAAIWDIGANSRTMTGIRGTGQETSGALINYRISNAFIVNMDSDREGKSASQSQAGAFSGGTFTEIGERTDGITLSNSYISRIVGAAAYGGRTMFNFIKDVNMENDGAAPCTNLGNGNERGGIIAPVDSYGNVITRAHAQSCMENAFMLTENNASAFTNRTRRIVSNIIRDVSTDAAGAFAISCFLGYHGGGVTMTRDLDFYNNVCDVRNNTAPGGTQRGVYFADSNVGKLTLYYNIFMNIPGAAVDIGGAKDEGYNRFINITTSPAVVGGAAASDVDSDAQDCFQDPATLRYWQVCGSPEIRRAPTGGPIGPLWWGIRSFVQFHPAVVPLMDADAFKNYDCRSCNAAYQDGTPR